MNKNELLNVDISTEEYNIFEEDTLVSNHPDITLKAIDELVREYCEGDTLPLAYNAAHMVLELLNNDIEKYIKTYEDKFPYEFTTRLLEVQFRVKDLMDCLK